MYQRSYYQLVVDRLNEDRKFIQVIVGPRQVGKTTLVKQVLKAIDKPYLFFSADNVAESNSAWVSDCWSAARHLLRNPDNREVVLVIDEIQKITNWSEVVKKEWDADSFNDVNIKVVLLGSSRVLIGRGLSESLMGRFEEIKVPHWSYSEMRDAFGVSFEQYVYFGAYPGAASLMSDEDRWSQYVGGAIVDASINKDILYNANISKPALLRQTFEMAAAYSGKILSLTKMQGSLQDAGNTTTLSGYLGLLDVAGLVTGLQKYAVDFSRRRASIPKFQVYNNALMSIYGQLSFDEAVADPKVWGRYFESAVGAHILNDAFANNYEVYYWRERDKEVDFMIRKNRKLVAIEVKSNSERYSRGLQMIREMYKDADTLVVGEGGIPAEEFMRYSPSGLFS